MRVQFKDMRIKTLGGKDAGNASDGVQTLQGAWQVSTVEVNGSALPSEDVSKILVTVKGTAYTVLNDGKSDPGSFTIDSSKQPGQMDIHPESGPDQGKTLLAIYEVASDTLRVCYAPEGAKRPTSFSTSDNSGRMLITYKRKNE